MKRRCLPLIALLLLAAAALLLAACAPLRENFLPTADELSSEVIRIHIRANGNGEADQRVKLAVRDALTEKLSVILADCATKSEAERALSAAKDELTQIADHTLESCGFDYKTRIVLTNEHFPEKDYGGYTFPEGDYDAMLVLLGARARERTGGAWHSRRCASSRERATRWSTAPGSRKNSTSSSGEREPPRIKTAAAAHTDRDPF